MEYAGAHHGSYPSANAWAQAIRPYYAGDLEAYLKAAAMDPEYCCAYLPPTDLSKADPEWPVFIEYRAGSMGEIASSPSKLSSQPFLIVWADGSTHGADRSRITALVERH